jgi:hypothetical protein
MKPAFLEKLNRRFATWQKNSTKSLCRLQDSDDFCFVDLLGFWQFYPSFSDNLVTLASFDRSRI